MSTVSKIIIGALIAAILYLLYLGNCKSVVPKPATPIDINVAIQNVRKQYADSLKFKDSVIAYNQEITEIAIKERNEAVYKLSLANEQATLLVNDLANAKTKHDTIEFIKTCDSLAELANRYRFLFTDMSAADDSIFASLGRQIYALEEKIRIKDNEIGSITDVAVKNTYAPKSKLLLGGGLIGNQFGFYGVEMGAYLKTKRDNLIGIGAITPFKGQVQFKVSYYSQFRKR